MDNRYIHVRNYLHSYLRTFMKEIIPLDIKYDMIFDYFEYWLGLINVDRKYKTFNEEQKSAWGPIGIFHWRYTYNTTESSVNIVGLEIDKFGDEWIPLKYGFFDARKERILEIKKRYDEHLKKVNWD